MRSKLNCVFKHFMRGLNSHLPNEFNEGRYKLSIKCFEANLSLF